MNDSAPTVFVIDDDPSVRKELERLVRAIGMEAATYASAQEYLERFDPRIPGCLVLDLVLPDASGLILQQQLTAMGGGPPIIFLTGQGTVPEIVKAMKQGAVEFLTKPVDERRLIDAIRDALELDGMERAARAELDEIRERVAKLTQRELQVLRSVVSGKLNKQTAVELGVGEKTIKVHRARVMEKMRVNSLAELVELAVRAEIRAPIPATPGRDRTR